MLFDRILATCLSIFLAVGSVYSAPLPLNTGNEAPPSRENTGAGLSDPATFATLVGLGATAIVIPAAIIIGVKTKYHVSPHDIREQLRILGKWTLDPQGEVEVVMDDSKGFKNSKVIIRPLSELNELGELTAAQLEQNHLQRQLFNRKVLAFQKMMKEGYFSNPKRFWKEFMDARNAPNRESLLEKFGFRDEHADPIQPLEYGTSASGEREPIVELHDGFIGTVGEFKKLGKAARKSAKEFPEAAR